MCKKLDAPGFERLLQSIDTVLFDADGVLWHENEAIPGSPEAVRFFREKGKRVFMVTNNSNQSRVKYEAKCERLGFEFDRGHVLTTSALLAHYLSKQKFAGKVYTICGEGVRDELKRVGIESIGAGPDILLDDQDIASNVKLYPDVRAVSIGYDPHFSYVKLAKATHYLRDQKCQFIATNQDPTFVGDGVDIAFPEELPGTTCLIAAVKEATGRNPVVLGKPHKVYVDFIDDLFGLDCSRTLMVGDRCNTDVKFGNDHGMHTLMVLTGVTSVEQLGILEKSERKDLVPKFYIESLGGVVGL